MPAPQMTAGSYITVTSAHDHDDISVRPNAVERYWLCPELATAVYDLIRRGLADDSKVVFRGLIPSILVHEVLEGVL